MFSKMSAPAPAAFRSTAVLFSVVAYSACSSTMLIVNKLAIRELPVPTLVRRVECSGCANASGCPEQPCWRPHSGSQLLFSSCFVLVLQALGLISMARPKRRVLEVRDFSLTAAHPSSLHGVLPHPRTARRTQPFALYTTCFAAGIYANIKVRGLDLLGASGFA